MVIRSSAKTVFSRFDSGTAFENITTNDGLQMSNAGTGITLLVVGVALAATFGVSTANMTHVATQTCTVTDKDRAKNSDGNSEMRVYTNECDVLKVSDSLIDGQFDSASIYGRIQVGQRYEFTTRGYRFPFFSMFPNIVDVKPA